MNPGRAILSTPELAAELGKARSTVWLLSVDDPVFRNAVVRRTRRSTWFSVQRLRDAGILPRLADVVIA